MRPIGRRTVMLDGKGYLPSGRGITPYYFGHRQLVWTITSLIEYPGTEYARLGGID
jgi:hypothetical protein